MFQEAFSRSTSCPGACAPRCTTPDRTDYRTELRRVHYRWHPFYGRDVPVRGTKKRRSFPVVRCQESDDETRDRREVPEWMLDPVRCEAMELSAAPYVAWHALCELRDLLLACVTPGVELEDPAPSSKMEEADAGSTPEVITKAQSGRTGRPLPSPAGTTAPCPTLLASDTRTPGRKAPMNHLASARKLRCAAGCSTRVLPIDPMVWNSNTTRSDPNESRRPPCVPRGDAPNCCDRSVRPLQRCPC